ncbi:BMP family ABC transporter substrate-binding protein [Pyrodictium abyssi]|uniref:BMP family ABC transporter substrate-binding protein n=1 Tax=Pyrodictium abyssi TaxID=54256 RepID=A0ABM8IW02_9CREN|nr:BMP family ABC transporter substrate-binding protein [Pyrodictium abyssi]
MASRREFIKILGAGVAGLVVGAGLGYSLRGSPQPRETTTSPAQAGGQAPAASGGARKVKALWVYVGPIGDYGWTHAHNQGRVNAEKALKGLVETKYLEKVAEDQAYPAIKQALEQEHFDAVFATSFGFMDAVKRLAKEYPDVMFYHCSGPWEAFKDLPNVATYFSEFYQLYYLNGIAAGAVTETCRVGYVPAFLIPEVVRHINAYALGAVHGAKLMGKCGGGENLEIYVTAPLRSWFNPDKARQYAETLINQYKVDVIAFTEDSTAVLETAAEYGVYSFSHYSNMLDYFTHGKGAESEIAKKIAKAHLTGQVADWTPIYVYLLAKKITGVAEKEDIWARIGDFVPIRWRRPVNESTAGKPEGAAYLAPLNTEVIPAKAVEEIKRLYEDMKELLFEPFTGPIRGYTIDPASGKQVGDVEEKVPAGVRWGRNELWSEKTMNWFYEKIITLGG